MSAPLSFLKTSYRTLLSEPARERSERLIIWFAIMSFIAHLLLIYLNKLGILHIAESELLKGPISAIYTPFSFILLYEVYLLVYYLPKSTTTYIGKQYEIVALIVIRRIFKDLSNLELTSDWFRTKYDLQFTYDIVAVLLLFFLILLFYRLRNRQNKSSKAPEEKETPGIKRFIQIKKTVSLILVPILGILAVYSLANWTWDNVINYDATLDNIYDINRVFFDDFFTLLILVDVTLLLFSFNHTGAFRKVIRNSGFTISTILIKISFGTDGLLNSILIVSAVAFGVAILWIHNLYEYDGFGGEGLESRRINS